MRIPVSRRFVLFLTATVICGAGCGSAPEARRPFTVAMLPDTQIYSKRFPDLFYAQTSWIRENTARENIVFVTQVGDIVNDHSRAQDLYQWDVASKAMSMLDGVVPWGVALGNHDDDSDSKRSGKATEFLKHFGPQRFEGRPWFAGASPNGLNTAQLFSGGGIDFLILHLEVHVPDEGLAWARQMLDRYPARSAILVTHSYLKGRDGVGRNTAHDLRRDGNSGESMWQELVRSSPQIFMVLCGHEGRTDEYRQQSVNDAGLTVYEILADYQKREKGGNGFLRLIQFAPAEKLIRVRTYSPFLKQFEQDDSSEFTLPWIPTAGPKRSAVARAGVLRGECL